MRDKQMDDKMYLFNILFVNVIEDPEFLCGRCSIFRDHKQIGNL